MTNFSDISGSKTSSYEIVVKTNGKEAFDALINAACFYGATIKVDTAISDNNDSDDDDFNTNEMRVSGNEPQSHFKDSSVSGLKNLIAKIESEKDLNEMTKKEKIEKLIEKYNGYLITSLVCTTRPWEFQNQLKILKE